MRTTLLLTFLIAIAVPLSSAEQTPQGKVPPIQPGARVDGATRAAKVAAFAQKVGLDCTVAVCGPTPGEGAVLPILEHRVNPHYTPAAMRAKLSGSILLGIVVKSDGSVGEIELVQGFEDDHGLNDAAIEAAKAWRFKPATRGGEIVPAVVWLEMTFTMK